LAARLSQATSKFIDTPEQHRKSKAKERINDNNNNNNNNSYYCLATPSITPSPVPSSTPARPLSIIEEHFQLACTSME